ncbi:MAG: hypothetical protein KY053_00895 [Candidatus Liptonbacteria bacterium]|nr:hypothetical protein [Candidatus Liptonbacteria bacterium]
MKTKGFLIQDKQEKSDQKIVWERRLTEVNEITNSLGKGVDEKIKESVATFLIHEFTTSGSCEGHLTEKGEDKHGLPYPWIEVYAPEPDGWKESEKKQKAWTIENLKQQQKMMSFLEQFYKDRETPFDARLTFDKVGAYGWFRVQNFGGEMWSMLILKEQKQKLELYRKEMRDFTEFLKDKYFPKE